MRKILLITIGLSCLLSAGFDRNDTTGIVANSERGLQWQDDYHDNSGNIKQASWQGAIDYCEALTLAGHSDWRLPNLRELTTLVNDTIYNPAISTAFSYTAVDFYWSATTDASVAGNAWFVHFYNGYHDKAATKTTSYYVRCVRAGQ